MAGSFSLDLSRIVAKAKGNIDLVVQKTTMDMFGRVIMRSPVDTGRFRGNWQASVGSYGSEFDLNTTDKTGSDAVEKASNVALSTPAGNVTFLVNNLPYAQRLEYGHSKQAPGGMVRLTAVELQQDFEKAARSV